MLKNGINTLKRILLILLAVCSFARDYYISFDFVSKNGQLRAEHFNCSEALFNTDSSKKLFLILPLHKDIKSTCLRYKDEIISKLLKKEIVISGSDDFSSKIKMKTKLVFLPQRFDIIIKGDEVYFYIKEEE